MTELLPSLQAEQVRRGLVDYLGTTFSLADAGTRDALGGFLQAEGGGIFRGPFARVRLPFLADPQEDAPLDWQPPFPPYRHQAAAYRRLTSKDLGSGKPRPLPTVVTTGTGSGKTEAFLHPILDHVLRARRKGQTGVKALILYPMNALADDQALRLHRLLRDDPALARVRAAIYTGDARDGQAGQGRSAVDDDGLITHRTVIRQDPPDILLTNYKMLDHMLLRQEDAPVWAASAESLQYLVLDEFHTYDGAQGTDVAMLLRRLGLRLADELRERNAAHPDLAWFERQPLGKVTPVATSATLGDGSDPAAMLSFAHQVFGERMEPNAAVVEERQPVEEFCAAAQGEVERAGLQPRRLDSLLLDEVQALADLGVNGRENAPRLVKETADILWRELLNGVEPGTALRAHPDVRRLLELAADAVSFDDLAAEVLPQVAGTSPAVARGAVATLLAALSHIRLQGRDQASVEVTLWVRELTRIDRVVSDEPAFRWSDDGHVLSDGGEPALPDLPAVFCRACGRSGWMAHLSQTGRDLADADADIRRAHLGGTGRLRALLHAPGEAARVLDARERGESNPEEAAPTLRWLDMEGRTIHLRAPAQDADDEAPSVPVVMIDGDTQEIEKRSQDDECPACGAKNSIRFLGSAIATLLSTTLTTLFGDRALDSAEKRALVFTDSVQDAAHRAGFIESRSYAMSLRAGVRGALTQPLSLPEWADAALVAAADDPFARYRLVPPALRDHSAFEAYWQADTTTARHRRSREAVRRRLLFDLELEAGLNAGTGRTLESTGSVALHVDTGGRESLLTAVRRAVADEDLEFTDEALLRWARGALERMRREGAIHHEWLTTYVKRDGARIWIWGKRRREQGAPAFPSGRPAPGFATVGGAVNEQSDFTRATSPKGWWAHWGRRCLAVSPAHAASLSARLLSALEEDGVVESVRSEGGAQVFGLPPERVVATPLAAPNLHETPSLLQCDTCSAPVPTAPAVLGELLGAPCFTVACPGHLTEAAWDEYSFYRNLFASQDVRRIVAREHTSLLDGEERREREAGFKRTEQQAGDPNVLVATPTLEMGIDIGDLTTVLLSSLPSSVASYLQRVGRAGRLTGSALALAYVTGRGDQLARLGEPLSVLNGAVLPPATYLDAEEILQRQFFASVVDDLARQVRVGTGLSARHVLANGTAPSLLDQMIEVVTSHGPELVSRFRGAFPDEGTPGLTALERWVLDVDGTEGLVATVHRAVAEYHRELSHHLRQQQQVQEALPALQATAQRVDAVEEDKSAYRSALGAERLARAMVSELQTEPWVGALELRGLLPNYSLIDDSVELGVNVTWRDPETGQYDSQSQTIDRPSSQALTEFAPGTHFYARGHEIEVKGVEISPDGADLVHRQFCDTCGYVADLAGPSVAAPAACPRCGSTGIADTGQRLTSLRLRRVFSDLHGQDHLIDDAHDQRLQSSFEVVTAVDFDPDRRERQWSLEDIGLGVALYRRVMIRWTNTGRSSGQPATRELAGQQLSAPLFSLCVHCGHLDRSVGMNRPQEHRGWCPQRNELVEDTHDLALHRELETQGVGLTLPQAVTADALGVSSLTAAVLLGLREVMGGEPDHLRVEVVPHPIGGADGQVRQALFLHDTVPGGTGYLTDLAEPERLFELLLRAAVVLDECPCADEGRSSCYRCLQPFAKRQDVHRSEALRHLRLLLGVDEGLPLSEVHGFEGHWTVAEREVATHWGESSLEQRFREALRERLAARVSVRDATTSTGPSLQITLGEGDARQLVSQQPLEGTQPDFLLRGGGQPDVAIYTDGWAYHASPQHNRLADDARKRAMLRDRGLIVLAATQDDLDRQDPPSFLAPQVISLLMGMGHPVSETVAEEQRQGPLGILEGLVLRGDEPARRSLAGLAPFLLFIDQQERMTVDADTDVSELAAALARGDEPPAGEAPALVWRMPHLGFVARMRDTVPEAMALVLDDAEAAVVSADHANSWRTWLRLSNLLGLAQVPTALTTTGVVSEASGSVEEAVAAQMPTDVGPQGPWGRITHHLYSEKIVDLAGALAEAGVAPPDEEDEVVGVMVDLVWSEHRVAVLDEDAEEADVDELERQGYRVHRSVGDAETLARTIARDLRAEN